MTAIDFDGLAYEIAPTRRKSAAIIHHPDRRFWVVEHKPKLIWPPILGDFTL